MYECVGKIAKRKKREIFKVNKVKGIEIYKIKNH